MLSVTVRTKRPSAIRRSLASCCRYTNSTNFSTSAGEEELIKPPFLRDCSTLAPPLGVDPLLVSRLMLVLSWPLGGSPWSLGLLCEPRGLRGTALRVRVLHRACDRTRHACFRGACRHANPGRRDKCREERIMRGSLSEGSAGRCSSPRTRRAAGRGSLLPRVIRRRRRRRNTRRRRRRKNRRGRKNRRTRGRVGRGGRRTRGAPGLLRLFKGKERVLKRYVDPTCSAHARQWSRTVLTVKGAEGGEWGRVWGRG
jgi:hypothetical protein